MRRTKIPLACAAAAFLVITLLDPAQRAAVAQGAVGAGDIVQTGMNGQPLIAEVIRVNGPTADLNIGQNNTSRLVSVQNMRVLQKSGAGAKATCAAGETVQVPYLGNTVVTGRLMKANGDYCQFDASGSGFTGWAKCAEIHRASGATCAPAVAAAGRGAASAAGPPRPGLASCAGKFEGRYATASGLGGLTIVFRNGKATLSGPLTDAETYDCWTGGGKILLHKQGEEDLPIDINDDGTLDTPLGELRKKSS